MSKLDRTEQRIVGVLIEKQLTVPDTYPLSENALVAGCNQSNNRDPVMELLPFQVTGALMSLQQKDVVARIEGGGRVSKYRHKLDSWLAVGKEEMVVLTELLLRGPQAPGALKPRVARMGYHATPEQIDELLHKMAQRAPALVALLPLRARERDRRWRHLIGDGSEQEASASTQATHTIQPTQPSHATQPSTATPMRIEPRSVAVEHGGDLEPRVAALEQTVQLLQEQLQKLLSPPQGD